MTAIAPMLAGLALGLSAIVSLHACASDGNAIASSTAASASPDDAISQFVVDSGNRYAGICEGTRSPEDVGKVCARLIDRRDGVQAYLIGRTFSEFSTWVFVAERDSGWRITATTPLDFLDTSGTIPWP